MRYLVTAQQHIPSTNYQLASVAESLEYLNKLDEIGTDGETLGFDPYTKQLISIQLGNEINQYFIDLTSVDIQHYKELLETKLLVVQNGKFDLKFLYHYRIIPSKYLIPILLKGPCI